MLGDVARGSPGATTPLASAIPVPLAEPGGSSVPAPQQAAAGSRVFMPASGPPRSSQPPPGTLQVAAGLSGGALGTTSGADRVRQTHRYTPGAISVSAEKTTRQQFFSSRPVVGMTGQHCRPDTTSHDDQPPITAIARADPRPGSIAGSGPTRGTDK